MNREQIARAIGAAIAQRKLMPNGGMESLDTFRRGVLAPTGGESRNMTESIDRFVVGLASASVKDKPAPEVVPPSVQGANIAVVGGTGSGDTWRPGSGATELGKHLDKEILNMNPLFTGAAAKFFVPLIQQTR